MEKKKRRAIKKEERLLIASKTNFRCGYCACHLKGKFHIDHIEAFSRTDSTCDEENLMAACIACNLFKSMLSLEQFRRDVSFQTERAFKYSVNFRTAFRFKQVKIRQTPIIFYFETLENCEIKIRHDWHYHKEETNYMSCKRCGVVRNKVNEKGRCKMKTKVELRK